ncbi:hypothetical protein BGZ47_004707, partial [Haplosporangium gracile]
GLRPKQKRPTGFPLKKICKSRQRVAERSLEIFPLLAVHSQIIPGSGLSAPDELRSDYVLGSRVEGEAVPHELHMRGENCIYIRVKRS